MNSGQYIYWTLECYDQENGIRGGGGLGVLAADTRRVADKMKVPLTLVTLFYSRESHQVSADGLYTDEFVLRDWRDFDYKLINSAFIKCNNTRVELNVVEKKFGSTRILAVTEPNIGSLYQDLSGSDHRLYQEVALGFGGYMGLKMLGILPSAMQLNEVVTVFAALAWLDDLVQLGVDFYQAIVAVRERTLYTNHTLVQAAEAEFTRDQFERFVMPNLESRMVRRFVASLFENDRVKLSTIALEIAGKRSGVSKLHARVADYHDLDGKKVEFKAITNGIDLEKWVMPEILTFYKKCAIIDSMGRPTSDFGGALSYLDAPLIRGLKARGRDILNEILVDYPDQNGNILELSSDDFVFSFKRRLVDYKRPEMPFENLEKLRGILEPTRAHYIIAGRVHSGDTNMSAKLAGILDTVRGDEYLSRHVHYLADYDERLAYGLSVGCNAALNLPVVGLEACGTSWEKDVANLQLLISTQDGGVADVDRKYHFDVSGKTYDEEVRSLYEQMENALYTFENDFDLEYVIREQLYAYLPIISGARMIDEYLDFMFSK